MQRTLQVVIAALAIALGMIGCQPAQSTPAPTAAASPSAQAVAPVAPSLEAPSQAAFQITGYEFPASIDPATRYMFYLHGKIVEDVGIPAVSPDFGEYEYADILKTLEGHGFVVISEQRSKDTDADAYARKVVGQVNTLLKAGVPAGNITVVGASKGAFIAATVSFLLPDPAINYVLIGTCHPDTVEAWKSDGSQFHGNVLTIRDVADLEYSGSCEDLLRISEGKGLGRHEEIVLQVGTGHGILFKPVDEWVLPTVQWATE
jgi:hypothetical protein